MHGNAQLHRAINHPLCIKVCSKVFKVLRRTSLNNGIDSLQHSSDDELPPLPFVQKTINQNSQGGKEKKINFPRQTGMLPFEIIH